MSSVVVDGIRSDTIENLKISIHGFFRELFTENEPWRPKVDGLSLSSLSIAARGILERQFDEEEITKALFNCCGDKVPGLDGMTMAFLQANWDIVRGEVSTMFSEFHLNGKFMASLNATFIRLIPKKADAQNIKDYRPICLIGCIYKLLSKVLARRLRSVIGSFISEIRMPLLWQANSGWCAYCK